MTADAAAGHIALLVQYLEDGGVERCFANLARGFAEHRFETTLYVHQVSDAPPVEALGGVRLSRLGERSRASRCRALAEALEGSRATVLLTAKEEDYRLAIAAHRLMARPIQLVMVASLDYTGQLRGRRAGLWKRWRRYRQLRQLFGQADAVFCVSGGVAEDMARILQRPVANLPILPNPVVTPELRALSLAPIDHPWLGEGQVPLILGVGRLSRIKNFPLLVRAFAEARRELPMHLLILGEGKQRTELLRLAARLGVADDVALPGFRSNPYPYMRRADLFVLSSSWEGFGNVLVEALACGTPAVATDCPSGPREILQDGRYGALVPVNDPTALATAIIEGLKRPLPPELLAQAVHPYTLENSTLAYLSALGFSPRAGTDRPTSHQL